MLPLLGLAGLGSWVAYKAVGQAGWHIQLVQAEGCQLVGRFKVAGQRRPALLGRLPRLTEPYTRPGRLGRQKGVGKACAVCCCYRHKGISAGIQGEGRSSNGRTVPAAGLPPLGVGCANRRSRTRITQSTNCCARNQPISNRNGGGLLKAGAGCEG